VLPKGEPLRGKGAGFPTSGKTKSKALREAGISTSALPAPAVPDSHDDPEYQGEAEYQKHNQVRQVHDLASW